jgi:uncharacterized protein YuzE
VINCQPRTRFFAPYEHLAEGIAADYDAEGRLAGIEILDALKRFDDPKVLRQVVLEDVGLARA